MLVLSSPEQRRQSAQRDEDHDQWRAANAFRIDEVAAQLRHGGQDRGKPSAKLTMQIRRPMVIFVGLTPGITRRARNCDSDKYSDERLVDSRSGACR